MHTLNEDWADALVGATTPEALASVADRMASQVDSVRTKEGLRYACKAASLLSRKLKEQATHNVTVASKAGLMPSRMLGVDSEGQAGGGIAAGGQLNVSSAPTIPVRVNGFRTDATFAADFNINNVRISTIAILVGDQAAPASAFTTGISLPPLSTPIASSGSPIITDVTNIGGAARRFRAVYTLAAIGIAC